MRSKNKENVIVLPNGDECPVGKTKDETKLLNLISAEYGMENDIRYFNLQKQKNKYLLKLDFIPSSGADLQTSNSKKFVIYELIRNGIKSVIRFDDDLNKRAAVILDLVNSTDPNSKETVRAKLSAILDESSDELEHLLDQLLLDAQFNSFKYSILNNKKMACILCVNTSGIFIRSTDSPFEIQDSVFWVDVKEIGSKQKKLLIHHNSGHCSEITCFSTKIARTALAHFRRYLSFLGTRVVPEPTTWFGRISLRIRKSFSRRSELRVSGHQSTFQTLEAPASSSNQQRSFAPSTIPESSFISEDVIENTISVVEPSLKTNSTYDVSLDVAGVSEVATSDKDSSQTSGKLSSFGAAPSRTSPLIIQVKKDVVLNEKDWNHPPIVRPEEPILPTITQKIQESPQLPTEKPESPETIFKPQINLQTKISPENMVKIGPAVPIRSDSQPFNEVKVESPPEGERQVSVESDKSDNNSLLLLMSLPTEPYHKPTKAVPETPEPPKTLPADIRFTETVETVKEEELITPQTEVVEELPPDLALENCLVPDPPVDNTVEDLDSGTFIAPQFPVQDDEIIKPEEIHTVEKIDVLGSSIDEQPVEGEEKLPDQNVSMEIADEKKEDVDLSFSTMISEPAKFESKLPISRQRTIPSPKVRRPDRVSSKGFPSPKEESNSFHSSIPVSMPQSPSDKENFQNCRASEGSNVLQKSSSPTENTVANFSRFENQEYKVDSKTTITTVSTVGDSIVKKSTQTEISSMKYTGIPTPKQYKSTTTITTTVKKPTDISKSPSNSSTKISTGIPRMSSK